MLYIPKKGVLRVEHNLGAVGTATPGTQVTTGAAASTKGSFVELIASTAFDAWWVTITVSDYSAGAADSRLAVDIGIGAATEEIIIPDMLAGGPTPVTLAGGVRQFDFPLYIPAGSRLAARGAGDRTSTNFRVGIILRGGDGSPPFKVAGRIYTYGISTVPAGTTITPGASGAEGAWAEIVASTSVDHFAFLPSFQFGLDTTKNFRIFYVDMGLGSATEELMIGGESFIYKTDTGEGMYNFYSGMPAFQDVPSGTRLVMRASNNGTNDGGSYNGVIHAMS